MDSNMLCKTCSATSSVKWYKQGTECKPCFSRAYRNANRSKLNELRRNWIAKNPEQNKAYKNQFETEHRDKYLKIHKHNEAKRRALKKAALPKWVDNNVLRMFYANCPDGYHVDHIIPLNNKDVCGLHVPWNSQYLPAEDNLKKGNSFNSESGTL